MKWHEWLQLDFEKGSIVQDPLFIDPEYDNYQLNDCSPAYRMGFKRIPIEKIGLYNSEFRATWPINTDKTTKSINRKVYIIRIPAAK